MFISFLLILFVTNRVCFAWSQAAAGKRFRENENPETKEAQGDTKLTIESVLDVCGLQINGGKELSRASLHG
jgi:hypothetical protein